MQKTRRSNSWADFGRSLNGRSRPAQWRLLACLFLLVPLIGSCTKKDSPTEPAEPLSVTTTSLPAAVEGIAYRESVTAVGGSGGHSWSLGGGSLPAGLALSSDGVISGVPTAAGTPGFTVRVESGDGQSATHREPPHM